MKLTPIVLLTALVALTGCVTTQFVYSTRTVAAISGTASSERPDYHKIESTLAGVTNIFISHGWTSHPTDLSYHLTGGRIYHINFGFTGFGCSAEMDRESATFRFYEWERSPHSDIFPATDDQRAQVRALAHEVEVYLRATLPSSYVLHFSES
jgi:hypothetical protein